MKGDVKENFTFQIIMTQTERGKEMDRGGERERDKKGEIYIERCQGRGNEIIEYDKKS